MARAEGRFDIDVWREEVYDEREGATLTRVHIGKTYRGDLAGTSTTEIITAVATGEKSMAYSGFERFAGTLAGREGTFVLGHTAIAGAAGRSQTWTILPDSGTGLLRDIHGAGGIDVLPDGTHDYHLDYHLP